MDIYVVKINDVLRRVTSDLNDAITYFIRSARASEEAYNIIVNKVNLEGKIIHHTSESMDKVEMFKSTFHG